MNWNFPFIDMNAVTRRLLICANRPPLNQIFPASQYHWLVMLVLTLFWFRRQNRVMHDGTCHIQICCPRDVNMRAKTKYWHFNLQDLNFECHTNQRASFAKCLVIVDTSIIKSNHLILALLSPQRQSALSLHFPTFYCYLLVSFPFLFSLSLSLSLSLFLSDMAMFMLKRDVKLTNRVCCALFTSYWVSCCISGCALLVTCDMHMFGLYLTGFIFGSYYSLV